MSFIIAEAEDVVANPLDLVEQIVIANEWPFDRQTEDEMGCRNHRQVLRLPPLVRLAPRRRPPCICPVRWI